MKFYQKILFVLCCVFVTSVQAEIQSQLEAFRVTLEKGEEVFSEADTAEPGHVLEYRLTYTNPTEGDFKRLIINGPIPDNTQFMGNSNNTRVASEFVVSFDNGASYQAEPAKRRIRNPDGSFSEQIVKPEEYTHIRWKSTEPLKAGASQTFVYRVQVQ